jgi:hypothetical protein
LEINNAWIAHNASNMFCVIRVLLYLATEPEHTRFAMDAARWSSVR